MWGRGPAQRKNNKKKRLTLTLNPDLDPDTDPVPDPETVAPPRVKKLSAKVGTPAATCTAAISTMAVAGRDPVAAAAAVMTTAMTTGTTQVATTAASTSDRGETNMTGHRRHTTTDLGATPEGGDSKDAAPTAAAAAVATEHRQCSPARNSYLDGKQKKRGYLLYDSLLCFYLKNLVKIVICTVHKKKSLKIIGGAALRPIIN
jgi:hypothetical protein